jgi:hypothetical protein
MRLVAELNAIRAAFSSESMDDRTCSRLANAVDRPCNLVRRVHSHEREPSLRRVESALAMLRRHGVVTNDRALVAACDESGPIEDPDVYVRVAISVLPGMLRDKADARAAWTGGEIGADLFALARTLRDVCRTFGLDEAPIADLRHISKSANINMNLVTRSYNHLETRASTFEMACDAFVALATHAVSTNNAELYRACADDPNVCGAIVRNLEFNFVVVEPPEFYVWNDETVQIGSVRDCEVREVCNELRIPHPTHPTYVRPDFFWW